MTGVQLSFRKALRTAMCGVIVACVGVVTQPLADPMRPFSIWLASPVDVAVPITAPIHIPEISRALRATPPPALTDFEVEISQGQQRGSEPHRLLRRARALSTYGGEVGAIPAIHVVRGSTDLFTLSKQSSVAPYLSCENRHCTLSAPVLVAEGAALRIDGARLDLIGETGAMLVNHGTLSVHHSDIRAVMKPGFRFGTDSREFRPFLAGLEGSDTRLIGSRFVDLGFNRPSSYGISIDARKGQREPTGLLVGNVFEGLYYGFYSHHARNIPIVDNLYRDNIVYGIDPHDYSYNLWILGNHAYGTHKKHGIIISRGVRDSVIAMNRSHDNAGSGIMLDRHSSNNLVIHNHNWRNANDGIAIYESSGNLIAHNSATQNGKTGLRIRNSQNLTIAHNYFGANATGIMAYTGRPGGFARRDEDAYTMEVQARLIANTVSGNLREDLSLKGCVSRMIFAEDLGKQPGFTTKHVRFGGDSHWKEMLRRVADVTRGDLDVRFECEAVEVDPAVERAEREAAMASPRGAASRAGTSLNTTSLRQ